MVLGTLDASMILVQYLVTGFIMLTTSITWKRHCFVFLMGFCPVITMTGIPHSCAYATPVIILVAHGPSVAMATHIFPVSLPYVAAINTADCSLRVTIRSIGELRSASTISRFSSQGTPYIVVTPCASRHLMKSDAIFIINLVILVKAVYIYPTSLASVYTVQSYVRINPLCYIYTNCTYILPILYSKLLGMYVIMTLLGKRLIMYSVYIVYISRKSKKVLTNLYIYI